MRVVDLVGQSTEFKALGAPTFLLKIVAAAVVCATMLLAIHKMGKKARRCSADALEWGRTLRVPRDGDGGRPRARAEWTSSTCWTVQLGSAILARPSGERPSGRLSAALFKQ